MLRRITIVAASGLILAFAATAEAQDRSLNPSYGSAKLQAGFQPDPYIVDVVAGGENNARQTIGPNCPGYVAAAPDFRVIYRPGDNLPLIFRATSAGDTMLLITDPYGNWICDDDSGEGLNPLIVFDTPLEGQYDIWVGTYGRDFAEARLEITQVPLAAPQEETLDWRLPPNFGTVNLAFGFLPDPQVLDLVAGGDLPARNVNDSCRGFVSAAPDIRLNYQAGGAPLFISVLSDADTTLVISDPFGNWICDDDSGDGLNPSIRFDQPASGQYDIWIGTYAPGPTAEATLYISELQPYGGTGLNWDLDPLFGEANLVTGFLPDPYWLDISAGGDVRISETAGDSCRGYATSAPTFRLYFEAGTWPLTIYAMSEADTTLAVADPDGNWFCNDDTNGLNPQITFERPLSGQYDIWVGTYGLIPTQAASLFISELGGPNDATVIEGGIIDWALTPNFTTIDLPAGFLPDPREIELTAGGAVPANSVNPACAGFVRAAPDVRLNYQAGSYPLYIWVDAEADAVLLISDPAGNWICDDDGGAIFFQPAIGFDAPLSGQYDIWVGTYRGDEAQATLYISEVVDGRALPEPIASPPVPLPDGPIFVDPTPPASGPVTTAALDWTLPATDGEVVLNAGFAPDPTTFAVNAGGPVDAIATEAACYGFVPTAPNVRLTYTATAWPLILSVDAEADTILVVRSPSGEWLCDDDSGNDFNPSIWLEGPETGQYDIWVGRYGSTETTAATLYISEVTTR